MTKISGTEKTNITILHIDDDKNILDIVRLLLRDKNYNLISELQGTKAIELALHLQPDLIILDIMMPEINGFELIKEIRGNPKIQNIPIMVLSVSNSESRCLELGANLYMSKPMNEIFPFLMSIWI